MNIMFILGCLFLLGAVLGAATNYCVDRHCWTPRFRSPWRAWPAEFLDRLNTGWPPGSKKRSASPHSTNSSSPFTKCWFDFLPVFGWLYLKRIAPRLEALPESERLPGLENRHFWIRPFAVEFLTALGLPGLYLWEVEMQMLRSEAVVPESWETLAARFAVHVFLLTLLLAASLIDIDDMIIPDILTVPGTLIGIALALWVPTTLLPATELQIRIAMAPRVAGQNPLVGAEVIHDIAPETVPLNVCSPNSFRSLWPKPFPDNRYRTLGIMTALWGFWCFAMLNRVWYARLPLKTAAAIFCRKLWRTTSTKWYLCAAILVPAVVFLSIDTNNRCVGTMHHLGLLSALVGMASGMAMIWSVRIIGRLVLGREAMGFGDVTLMGMIGAYVGWQSCILIFFLAPFAGLVLGIINAVSGRGREFPYGPFLCLATAGLIVFWSPIWDFVTPIFELGWIVAVVMLACLVMLGVLLGLWRWIRGRLIPSMES